MALAVTAKSDDKVGVTAALIADVVALSRSELPADVLRVARHGVLDWFGGAISGSQEPVVLNLLEEARENGAHPLCSTVGHPDRTSPGLAALINGTAADALDFSDINQTMRGHTTPAVVAATLALAESRNATGIDVLRAIVAGVEMECRLGLLTNWPMLKKGFHPTGNFAIFGAAAAAAWLLDLKPDQWAHALGLAATQAAGLLASGGTMSKPFHSGRAAMSGILAAKLASRGFIARPDAIEAEDGFLETHAPERHDDVLNSERSRYLILQTIFKTHAACVLTHGSIENMLKLSSESGVTSEKLRHLEIQVAPVCLTVCNIPEATTGLEAKFSLRTVSAMALLGDDTREISTYTAERASHPDVRQLRDRISVSARDDLKGGVSVAIAELTDSRRLTATSDSYRRQDDLELQQASVIRKFHSLATPIIGEARAARLQQQALTVDQLTSVKPLIDLSTKLEGQS
jgi:2-methylcitrate dehydratase PrpD